MRKQDGVERYAAKYATKAEQKEGPDGAGRWWGWLNWGYGEIAEFELTFEGEPFQVWFWLAEAFETYRHRGRFFADCLTETGLSGCRIPRTWNWNVKNAVEV